MKRVPGAFALRLPPSQISYWSEQYSYRDEVPSEIGKRARSDGHLTRDDFLQLAAWKSPRSKPLCHRNSESYVRAITSVALTANEPRLKIEVLRLLDGVDWPTASAVLHFCDTMAWPIIDYRAFWSLKQPAPAGRYSFALWNAYTDFTRSLARQHGVPMRVLDRALWAYSKAKQRKPKKRSRP